jgi:hypothetical protein
MSVQTLQQLLSAGLAFDGEFAGVHHANLAVANSSRERSRKRESCAARILATGP